MVRINTHVYIYRGLNEANLMYAKYRFNQSFHLIGADNFLKDLFNDKTILSTFPPVAHTLGCSDVKFKRLNAEVINMAWFDFLKEKGIVMEDGKIK